MHFFLPINTVFGVSRRHEATYLVVYKNKEILECSGEASHEKHRKAVTVNGPSLFRAGSTLFSSPIIFLCKVTNPFQKVQNLLFQERKFWR